MLEKIVHGFCYFATKMSFLLLRYFSEKSGLTVCQNLLLSVTRDISILL